MFTGRRNGQASSCCSNCSRSILQGASSRCCFFVSVRLLPSFRGEAVGVAGSDELTSSTCVFDAVDGVGLRRKTTEKLFARLTSVLQEVSRHKKPLDECARTNRISIQSCVRLRRVRCSRWDICVLSLTLCLSFVLYYFFSFYFLPTFALSRFFFRFVIHDLKAALLLYDEFFWENTHPPTVGDRKYARQQRCIMNVQGVPTEKSEKIILKKFETPTVWNWKKLLKRHNCF